MNWMGVGNNSIFGVGGGYPYQGGGYSGGYGGSPALREYPKVDAGMREPWWMNAGAQAQPAPNFNTWGAPTAYNPYTGYNNTGFNPNIFGSGTPPPNYFNNTTPWWQQQQQQPTAPVTQDGLIDDGWANPATEGEQYSSSYYSNKAGGDPEAAARMAMEAGDKHAAYRLSHLAQRQQAGIGDFDLEGFRPSFYQGSTFEGTDGKEYNIPSDMETLDSFKNIFDLVGRMGSAYLGGPFGMLSEKLGFSDFLNHDPSKVIIEDRNKARTIPPVNIDEQLGAYDNLLFSENIQPQAPAPAIVNGVPTKKEIQRLINNNINARSDYALINKAKAQSQTPAPVVSAPAQIDDGYAHTPQERYTAPAPIKQYDYSGSRRW